MTRKTHHTTVRIPADPDRRSQCVRCIEQRIASHAGVHAVRVRADGDQPLDGRPAALELDYDPTALSLEQLNRYVSEAGACLEESHACLLMPIRGLASKRGEQPIEAALNRLPGVRVKASFATQTLRLEFDRSQCALPEIVRRLERLGIELESDARPAAPAGDTEQPSHRARQKHWLVAAMLQPDLLLALLGGVLLVIGGLTRTLDGPAAVWGLMLAGSYVCCGWHTAFDVVRTLRKLKFDIDVLMFAAAFGAASLGHYEEGALLLLLFSLGGAGQRLAMNRARGAIRALATLSPQTATRLDPDDQQQEVGVDELRIGDRVLVQPGGRFPTDGVVASGASAVDQSPITGESIPVEKTMGDDVYAGTINGQGVLIVRVTTSAGETTLAKVIRLVEQAQTTKSPTQLFTDKVEKWYVPAVLVGTAGLILVPPLLAIAPARDHGLWAGWFYQAMAFLTAASPCALAIGTPAAVLSGIGKAARGGVLIKGGGHLENLADVRAVAFDKTGTLTAGRPELTDLVVLTDDISPEQLLAYASAVERASHHPLAAAIVAECEARQCESLAADRIEQVSGLGITGRVGGHTVRLGRLPFFEAATGDLDAARRQLATIESQGRTAIVVAIDDRLAGVIGLADMPRPGAKAMIARLRTLGVRRTVMLTGDNEGTAAAVAAATRVDEYHAALLPVDKLNKIAELNERYKCVAMVGDGVNDAPALATATVGIAIGGAAGGGSDAALETADIALLADDLDKLPEAIGLARMTKRIIRQNLVLALGVIMILAPFAAMGMTTIYAAVMLHEGSTVLVVINALRILAYRERPSAAA